jgi:hypothetical protein
MGYGQKIGLHLSNARKDTLQLRFSKMGLRSATVPDAIVADKMEVENLERHSTPSAGEDWDV